MGLSTNTSPIDQLLAFRSLEEVLEFLDRADPRHSVETSEGCVEDLDEGPKHAPSNSASTGLGGGHDLISSACVEDGELEVEGWAGPAREIEGSEDAVQREVAILAA
jgi:hypothetical protein